MNNKDVTLSVCGVAIFPNTDCSITITLTPEQIDELKNHIKEDEEERKKYQKRKRIAKKLLSMNEE